MAQVALLPEELGVEEQAPQVPVTLATVLLTRVVEAAVVGCIHLVPAAQELRAS